MSGVPIHNKLDGLRLTVCDHIDRLGRTVLVSDCPHITHNIVTAQLLGTDRTAHGQLIQNPVVGEPSQLRDDLRRPGVAADQGNKEIHFVHSGQCDQYVTFSDPLPLQQQLIAGVAMHHRHIGKLVG